VIFQYVDTDDAAYHACGANYAGQVGIENESASSGDLWLPLTDEQVSACARILAWLHDEHGVELRVADINDRRGVGYHSMVPGPCTANDWGSTGCPGPNIVAQRDEIVRQAQGGAGPTPEPETEDDVFVMLYTGPESAGARGVYVFDALTIYHSGDVNALGPGRTLVTDGWDQVQWCVDRVNEVRRALDDGMYLYDFTPRR
jgi:hypothetical protein